MNVLAIKKKGSPLHFNDKCVPEIGLILNLDNHTLKMGSEVQKKTQFFFSSWHTFQFTVISSSIRSYEGVIIFAGKKSIALYGWPFWVEFLVLDQRWWTDLK